MTAESPTGSQFLESVLVFFGPTAQDRAVSGSKGLGFRGSSGLGLFMALRIEGLTVFKV